MTELPPPVERTIVAIDLEGFGSRHLMDADRAVVREGLYEVTRESFTAAGIDWARCDLEDRGDGLLILAPPSISKQIFATSLPFAMMGWLETYNARHSDAEQIRLRMAVHSGGVSFDSNGMFGGAVTQTVRLLDSADLRLAFGSSQGVLAVIISSSFFDEVVRLHPDLTMSQYRPVHVSVKETDTDAWISVPGSPIPQPSVDRSRYCDFTISYAAADGQWASWIARQLRDAGYTVERHPLGPLHAAGNVRANRTIVVLSPAYVRDARVLSRYSPFSERSIPVRIAPTEPTVFDDVPGVDLVEASPEMARQEFLAAIERIHRPLEAAPSYPGSPGPPGRVDPEGSERPLVLAVHAVADRSAAIELSDSLRVLETEDLLAPVELRAVGHLDEETEAFVDNRVHRASIILLLVSRDLLATGYGTGNEMRLILRLHEERQVVVLPVILRPTSWERSLFGRLPPLPSDGVPVSRWKSRDEAVKNIIDGVRLAAGELRGQAPRPLPPRVEVLRQVYQTGAVFMQTGVPDSTFVEPNDFFEFRMALRQPGLGVILEGPAGSGKTTLLQRAVLRDRDRLGEPEVLSARRATDLPKIWRLLDGHTGLVAVDDFQRLPLELQDRLADYLKLLADDDTAANKLVVVGIPGTATNLITLSPDLATRIQTFRLGQVDDELVLRMIEQGEDALNITFDRKAEIVRASMGSLLTAQMLCLSITLSAGIEKTLDTPTVVRTDLDRARVKVAERVRLKYQHVVDGFVVMDGPDELLCIDLLLSLARTTDGILRLDALAEQRPDLAGAIRRVFIDGLRDGLPKQHKEIFYDPRGHRLIADDPQFLFYLGQLTREQLLEVAGKRLPVPRDQIFICYSHNEQDVRWKERVCVHLRPLERDGALDVWSDSRIAAGDMWREEIAAALDRARAALLLISADFFASEFIHSDELPALLAAAESGGCRVIPLLVRPSMFEDRPELARFQSVPGGTTLSEMSQEEAERTLVTLARSIVTG